MTSGPAVQFLKWSTKVGIFGGTVYLVTANGLWSDNKEYSSVKAFQDLRKNADRTLGADYLSKVSLPDLDMADKWNYGVSKSFDYAADLPEKAMNKFRDGLEYIHEKLK